MAARASSQDLEGVSVQTRGSEAIPDAGARERQSVAPPALGAPAAVLALRRTAGNLAAVRALVGVADRRVLQRVRRNEDRQSDIDTARGLLDGYLATHVAGQRLTEPGKADIVKNAGSLVAAAQKRDVEFLIEHRRAQPSAQASEAQRRRIDIEGELHAKYKGEDLEPIRAHARSTLDSLIAASSGRGQGYESEKQSVVGVDKKGTLIQMLAGWEQEKDKLLARASPSAAVGSAVQSHWTKVEYWQEKGEDLRASPARYAAPAIDIGDECEAVEKLINLGKDLTTSPEDMIGWFDAQTAWMEQAKGKRPMWCDQSTAIIVATLAGEPSFRSSLEVVKQGIPSSTATGT